MPDIDYDALAKQNGAISSAVDYDALAKQHGAVSAEAPHTNFVGNVFSSAGRLVGDVAHAVTHPVETAGNIGDAVAGGVIKGAQAVGVPGQLTDEERGQVSKFDAIVDNLKNRYGSLDGIKKTLYEDPVGAMADLATITGGAGVVAKAGRLGKTAKVLETISSAVDPMSNVARAGKAATAGVAKSADAAGIAERLYQNSLKPPPGSSKVSAADVQRMVKTGLQEGIPVTHGGLDRLQSKLNEVNAEIKAKINPAVDIDPNAVASRLNDTRRTFANQVNPSADLAAIDTVEQNFRGGPGAGPIPADMAQAVKEGTYSQLRKKFGELSNASAEAEKSLARGLKEELASAFPELSALNARDGRLIQLESALQRAVKRIGNRENIPIGDFTLAAVKSVIDSPTIKSHLAIALDGASRKAGFTAKVGGTPRMATITGRIQDYINSLNPEQSTAQPSLAPAQ